MIYELLTEGRQNARTGKELAAALNCDIRIVTDQIEKERRAGHPICAATGEKPGYFIAKDTEELQAYCDQLKGRALEIFKTRQALAKILQNDPAQQQEG